MEPTYKEIVSKSVCKKIVSLFEKIGKVIPKDIKKASEDYYGNSLLIERAEELLYNTIQNLDKDSLNKYIYNGRDKDSRDLANWYEEKCNNLHQMELAESNKKEVEDILSKLRLEEIELIKNYYKRA